MQDWISIREAARRLGVTTTTVYSWRTKKWVPATAFTTMVNGQLLVDFTVLLQPRAKPPKSRKRPRRSSIGVIRIATGRRKRADERDSTTVAADTQGRVEGGGTQLSDTERLRVDHDYRNEGSGGAQAVGGTAGRDGQGGGATTTSPQPSPAGPTHTTSGGGSSQPLHRLTGDEDDGQGADGEGPDILVKDEGVIRLVVPSAELLASDTDYDTKGDGERCGSDV